MRNITIGGIDKVTLNIKRGTVFRVDLRCKDEDGAVIDLTDYTAAFRAFYRDTLITKASADLLDKTTDGDADIGMIHIVLDKTDTRLVPLGQQMQWAVEVSEPGDTPPGSGDQIVIVEGFIVGEQGSDNDD